MCCNVQCLNCRINHAVQKNQANVVVLVLLLKLTSYEFCQADCGLADLDFFCTHFQQL